MDDVQTSLFPAPPRATRSPSARVREAKESVLYAVDQVVRQGYVSGVGELLDRITALCVGTRYSPFNCLLMLAQLPAARIVLPAHRWEERFGHVPRPGESPLLLLRPGGPVLFLYDVSQVEPGVGAAPLPAFLQDPYRMADVAEAGVALDWIVENARHDGVRVLDAALGLGFAGCVRRTRSNVVQQVEVRRRPRVRYEEVPVQFDVQLNRGYSPTEQLMTLAHELGHVYCGHLGGDALHDNWRGRPYVSEKIHELEAESVARVVVGRLCPGVRLPGHHGIDFDRADLHGESLERVLRAAGRIIEMAGGWKPRWNLQRPPTKAQLAQQRWERAEWVPGEPGEE